MQEIRLAWPPPRTVPRHQGRSTKPDRGISWGPSDQPCWASASSLQDNLSATFFPERIIASFHWFTAIWQKHQYKLGGILFLGNGWIRGQSESPGLISHKTQNTEGPCLSPAGNQQLGARDFRIAPRQMFCLTKPVTFQAVRQQPQPVPEQRRAPAGRCGSSASPTSAQAWFIKLYLLAAPGAGRTLRSLFCRLAPADLTASRF